MTPALCQAEAVGTFLGGFVCGVFALLFAFILVVEWKSKR